MSIITSIKPQKNKKRINVYLDDKFGFGIDLENFTKLGLKVEQELTKGKIKKILKISEFQKILDKLLVFSTLRPRSIKEINDWFKKHKVHESLHNDLFNRLKRLDLIDDNKFAQWWVEQRLQFKLKSKRELAYELRIKGIDREIIENVITNIKIDEKKIAGKLLKKVKYRWRNKDKLEIRKKMTEYLARKGFNWEIIREVVKDNS